MTFNISPSVKITEFDFTQTTEALSSTLVGGVIQSTRGEAYVRIPIANEKVMVDVFNKPTDRNFDVWFPANRFLNYASSLYLVRAVIRRDSIENALSHKRLDGTKPTVNAQLGVFLDDGQKYPNVKLELDPTTLSGNFNSYQSVIEKKFRVPEMFHLSEYFSNAYGAGNVRTEEPPLVKINFSQVTDFAAEVSTKEFDFFYYDYTTDTEVEIFTIYFISQSDIVVRTSSGNIKTTLNNLMTNIIGKVGGTTAKSNFFYLRDSSTNDLWGIIHTQPQNTNETGTFQVGDISHDANSVANQPDFGRIYQAYDDATPLDVFATPIAIEDDAGTWRMKLGITENTQVGGVTLAGTLSWKDYNSGDSFGEDTSSYAFTTILQMSGYFDQDDLSYSNSPIFNYSPILTGQFSDIENEVQNLMEIKVLSPQTTNGTDIPAKYDWYLDTATGTLPQDQTTFNQDLFSDVLKIIILDDTVNNNDYTPDAYIVQATEYVPLNPVVNNEFPFVEIGEVDEITGQTIYKIDVDRNQELQIFNKKDFDYQKEGIQFENPNEALRFISRWTGSEGNNVWIATCTKLTYKTASIWEGLLFSEAFEFEPESWDELCVAVIFEEEGILDVKEKYYVSLIPTRKDPTGKSMWIEDIINEQSSYVYVVANTTQIDAQQWYKDPTTGVIDYTINPNEGSMPYELNTISHYFNRVEGIYKRLPLESALPDTYQEVDSEGLPIGSPIELRYYADDTGTIIPGTEYGVTLPLGTIGVDYFTAHVWEAGWLLEVDGYYPGDVYLENIFHLYDGHDGVNKDGVLGRPSTADVMAAYDEFADPEENDIDILIDNGWENSAIAAHLDQISVSRRDNISIIAIPKTVIFGKEKIKAVNDIVKYRNSPTGYGSLASTYSMIIGNIGYMFDKFNDKYRWVNLTGDVAGLAAETDEALNPWWAFAGYRRGKIRGLMRLAYNPNLTLRDELFKNQVNPIFSSPGDGIVLLGEKMSTRQNTAFAEVHIRRLAIVIEKAIATEAKYYLFEFNDQFTRNQFTLFIEPLLSTIKTGRGLEDYLVVCDESNNGPNVRNQRQMFADIFIVPMNAINHIGINVIATKAGVSFSEVEIAAA